MQTLKKILLVVFILIGAFKGFTQFRLDFTPRGFLGLNTWNALGSNEDLGNYGILYSGKGALDFSYALNFRHSFFLAMGYEYSYWGFENANYFNYYTTSYDRNNHLFVDTPNEDAQYNSLENHYFTIGLGHTFKLTERVGLSTRLDKKILAKEYTSRYFYADDQVDIGRFEAYKSENMPKSNYDFSVDVFYYILKNKVRLMTGFTYANLKKIDDSTPIQQSFQINGPRKVFAINYGLSIKLNAFSVDKKITK